MKVYTEKTNPVKEYPIAEVVWKDAEEKGETGWNDLKRSWHMRRNLVPL